MMLTRLFNKLGETALQAGPAVQEAALITAVHYGALALRLLP